MVRGRGFSEHENSSSCFVLRREKKSAKQKVQIDLVLNDMAAALERRDIKAAAEKERHDKGACFSSRLRTNTHSLYTSWPPFSSTRTNRSRWSLGLFHSFRFSIPWSVLFSHSALRYSLCPLCTFPPPPLSRCRCLSACVPVSPISHPPFSMSILANTTLFSAVRRSCCCA